MLKSPRGPRPLAPPAARSSKFSATKTTSVSTSRWSSASTIFRASSPITSSPKPAPSLISTPKSSPPAATSAICPSLPSTAKPRATSTMRSSSNYDAATGHWHLQVHIADVAHYVIAGTALDLEARLRGNSVYFPDRAIPMLPQELSTNICSLSSPRRPPRPLLPHEHRRRAATFSATRSPRASSARRAA